MKKIVIKNATLQCNQGTSTASLSPTSHSTTGNDADMATVDDYQANTNIPAFGNCISMSNPQVSAATSAAQGVLQPQPCNPVISSKWSPGCSDVTVDDVAALTDDSTCSCTFGGGTIQIVTAASSDVVIDE